jgi:hypothetical protein
VELKLKKKEKVASKFNGESWLNSKTIGFCEVLEFLKKEKLQKLLGRMVKPGFDIFLLLE